MKNGRSDRSNPPASDGITGANGTIYGIRLLEMLRDCAVEHSLIMPRDAQMARARETRLNFSDVERLSTVAYPNDNIGPVWTSGSFSAMGLIIAPCPIKSMSEIVTAILLILSRAALKLF